MKLVDRLFEELEYNAPLYPFKIINAKNNKVLYEGYDKRAAIEKLSGREYKTRPRYGAKQVNGIMIFHI